jgi:hypothetical protein
MGGGTLTLGGYLPDVNTSPVQWLPPATATGAGFLAGITAVMVGNTTVVPAGGPVAATIDSGSPFTWLPSDVYSATLAGVLTACAKKGACVGQTVRVMNQILCYSLPSPAALSTFPSVGIVIAGLNAGAGATTTTLVMPPSSVWVATPQTRGAYCMSIYEGAVPGAGTLGLNALFGTNAIFNLNSTTTYVLGFANATCA